MDAVGYRLNASIQRCHERCQRQQSSADALVSAAAVQLSLRSIVFIGMLRGEASGGDEVDAPVQVLPPQPPDLRKLKPHARFPAMTEWLDDHKIAHDGQASSVTKEYERAKKKFRNALAGHLEREAQANAGPGALQRRSEARRGARARSDHDGLKRRPTGPAPSGFPNWDATRGVFMNNAGQTMDEVEQDRAAAMERSRARRAVRIERDGAHQSKSMRVPSSRDEFEAPGTRMGG